MLVMIGVTDMGRKELVAVELGYKENAENWRGMMHDLKAQGLAHPPELVIADGALGLWKAVSQEWPSSKHQRCWVHKSQNVLCKLPKTVQKTAKGYLHDIWQAETKKNALASFDKMVEVFEAKYPKAMQCLTKDKEQMLAFYDFPAVHWHHIRTSNAIESVFSTVRLRTDKIKNCVSEKTLSSLVFKLAQSAEKNWQKIRGFDELKNIIQGINFVDGIKQNMLENSQRYAA
jgi:transposase-like protein